MRANSTKINFRDARGVIRDIITHANVDAVTLITCAKGAVRGNHYHKKTVQYDYVLSGRMLCVSKDMKNGKKTRRVLKEGDLAFHPANEAHAFKALEKSTFLSLTKGPRKGNDFEKDTFRLEVPLIPRN
ncbi:MAG TPA: cupin domain-containing protein [Candidatus Paceibacterota bacterium]|nr:cupin domain-containing protein [Candidatus Paceibacterota bacterium]